MRPSTANKVQGTSTAKTFKNTPMGFLRIKRNLDILKFSNSETETYKCRFNREFTYIHYYYSKKN